MTIYKEMICSAPSLGSKEANDWTIAVPCALKRAHELGVSLYARTCYTRALKIDTFSARVRVVSDVAMKLTGI